MDKVADGGQRTAVYIAYDKGRQVLYVGLSNHPLVRLGQHARNSEWAEDVHHIDVEYYSSREAAAAREHLLIYAFSPPHNVSLNYLPRDPVGFVRGRRSPSRAAKGKARLTSQTPRP